MNCPSQKGRLFCVTLIPNAAAASESDARLVMNAAALRYSPTAGDGFARMISDRSAVAAAEEPMDPIVLAAIEVAMELLITQQGPPRCGRTNLAISAVFQRDGHDTQSHPIPEGSF
jgi:hypothetical protein